MKENDRTIDDLCTVKETGVIPKHSLYDCENCYGKPGSCPNYISHLELMRTILKPLYHKYRK